MNEKNVANLIEAQMLLAMGDLNIPEEYEVQNVIKKIKENPEVAIEANYQAFIKYCDENYELSILSAFICGIATCYMREDSEFLQHLRSEIEKRLKSLSEEGNVGRGDS